MPPAGRNIRKPHPVQEDDVVLSLKNIFFKWIEGEAPSFNGEKSWLILSVTVNDPALSAFAASITLMPIGPYPSMPISWPLTPPDFFTAYTPMASGSDMEP